MKSTSITHLKNKKVILLIFSIILLSVYPIIYFNNEKTVTKEEDTKSELFSYMIETSAGSGDYEMATDNKWPGEGYVFNESLSGCENGSKLTWNDETKSVTLKANISDKCYLYFDKEPPDVTLVTNNTDNVFNPTTPATLNCVGSNSIYNQKYQRIEVASIENKYTTCNLTYQTPSSKNYLNNYITSLAGQTQGDGQVVNENGYRYEGKNPNNYIWFNNELWRIIGVFDENSHGQSGENLVKIIRNDSIGGLVWDKSSTNDWSTSSLKILLNENYYNATDGTGDGNCYGYSTSIPSNCDYTEIGINDTYRSMIKNVIWYLGGYSSTSATADDFYDYERGTSLYDDNPISTEGYIGLMYPSDYGYSVLASSCARTTNLNDYDSSTCAGESWMYGKGNEWTITSFSSNNYIVYYLLYLGYLGSLNPYNGFGARPVLYLNSNVYVVDGSGTMSDPYIIGM